MLMQKAPDALGIEVGGAIGNLHEETGTRMTKEEADLPKNGLN